MKIFSFCAGLFVVFEELLQEFDIFIGHICYGVGVGALEVDVPEFGDDFAGLGLKVLGLTLMELAVDIVVGIAHGVYDPR